MMTPVHHKLEDGRTLLIREAEPEDAAAIISYIERISGESDFLSMGPGEFGIAEEAEVEIIRGFRDAPNQLFLLGMIDDDIVASLSFSARQRPRIRHTGSFGMSVRKEFWGRGIGGLMLDTLIGWARRTGTITKINLHVRPDNYRGLALYLSREFIVEGRVSRTIRVDGVYHDSYVMGLEIG